MLSRIAPRPASGVLGAQSKNLKKMENNETSMHGMVEYAILTLKQVFNCKFRSFDSLPTVYFKVLKRIRLWKPSLITNVKKQSLGSLCCVVKTLIVSGAQQTSSPFELFWTA